MGVTLFTSRIILQSLGVEDYGIYNVVGGIIAMFTFISGSLTTASQRFITFELGKEENGDLSKVFSTCLILHLVLAIIIAIIAEPIGIWFITHKLQIPAERTTEAIWVYHFSILSMITMFISVPYNAIIVAHERMDAFALISIIEALLRLGIAYSLIAFGGVDKLILYGALMFIAQLIIRVCYTVYCARNFKEYKFIRVLDKKMIKEMGSFASWSIFGNAAFVTYTQGLNLLLGTFFAPGVNAARGIAVQVQGAVNTFVNSFQTAINPQITKHYASGNIQEMISLVFRSSRFSFYLLMLMTIPILLQPEIILKLWLNTVPDYSVIFLQIILVTTWINSIANPLIISVKATGKIKIYEATVGSLMILILPISYVFLKLEYNPEIVFLVHLAIECCAMAFRIWNTSYLLNFSLKSYFSKVLANVTLVAIASFIIPYFVSINMSISMNSLIIVTFTSLACSFMAISIFGLTRSERNFIIRKIKR